MKRLAASIAIAATGIARLVTHYPHHDTHLDTAAALVPDVPVTQAVDPALERHVPIVVSRGTPRTRPAPTTTTVRRVLTVTWAAGWRQLISQLFGAAAPTAFRVVQCESGGNPDAHNPSGANGLFQVLGGSFDPDTNVEEAYRMWRQRGWEPWTASEHCWRSAA